MSYLFLPSAAKWILEVNHDHLQYLEKFRAIVFEYQECSKKFCQPGNHKLQAGSWLKNFLSHEAARNIFKSLLGGPGACSPGEV